MAEFLIRKAVVQSSRKGQTHYSFNIPHVYSSRINLEENPYFQVTIRGNQITLTPMIIVEESTDSQESVKKKNRKWATIGA